MYDELLFTHDDDPFLYDVMRAQLDEDAAIGEGNGVNAKNVTISDSNDTPKGTKLEGEALIGELVSKMFKHPETGSLERYSGEVDTYLPAESTDQEDYWGIQFEDGDRESWTETKCGQGRCCIRNMRKP